MALLPPYTLYLSGVRNDVTDAVVRAWEGPGECPLGLLVQPLRREYLGAVDYDFIGIDNGLFTDVGKARFDPNAYLGLVREGVARWGDRLLFATAPDVPFDWPGTLAKSLPFVPRIRATGAPVAIVAQNGATPANVPWDQFDAIFLGGGKGPDTGGKEWKETPAAAAVAREAIRRRKWVHMGRVNSDHRMRVAQQFGCGSADGTYLLHATAMAVASYALRRLVVATAHLWARSDAEVARVLAAVDDLRNDPTRRRRAMDTLAATPVARARALREVVEALELPLLPGEDFWTHGKRRRDALEGATGRAVTRLAEIEGRGVGDVADEVRSAGEFTAVDDILRWMDTLRIEWQARHSRGMPPEHAETVAWLGGGRLRNNPSVPQRRARSPYGAHADRRSRR